MTVIYPLLYMLGGLVVGRYLPSARKGLSAILTRGLIPFVIAYNLLTYQAGTALLAIFCFVFCTVLFLSAQVFWRDKLRSLTFSYLNIGWLGLPLAIAIFGDAASRIIIAAYIGGSVFGNIACVLAMQDKASGRDMVRNTLFSPPVLAVFAGLSLHVLPLGLAESSLLAMAYELAKQLMTIAGMCTLGIWLYCSKMTTASLRAAVPISLLRAGLGGGIVGLFVWLCQVLEIELVAANAAVLFILPLLPPAANTVVLETYYRGTGQSAQAIASGTLVSLGLLSLFAVATLLLPH
ncbi:hypothetical protein DFO67_101174 [Modicisalibacter xianhensis]|uniref:Permease n=1 Tax=Modicisalibacter xianhensis TaxID=442341 RepID=A0A4R8G994_9GAMM|nr:permease [Halomonas xianhensis]TDX32880.1 hypothetical protein DFO67_101174 [Halomonas xianhensis]